MKVPIIGRLGWGDYGRLLLAMLILISEWILRLITLVMPVRFLDAVRMRLGFGTGQYIFRPTDVYGRGDQDETDEEHGEEEYWKHSLSVDEPLDTPDLLRYQYEKAS